MWESCTSFSCCDLPGRNESGRCPVLDLAVWKDNQGQGGATRIWYSFYEKPVTAPIVFHSRAAYGWRPKIVTLSEELRRRYRNTDRFHTSQEVDCIVERFLIKLANSGYGQDTRSQIIRSATVKFYREVLDHRTGGKRLYRTSGEMEKTRVFKGLDVKTWFRPKRGGSL